MNDHRTFLPYVGLVIAMAGAAALLLSSAWSDNRLGAKAVATCVVVLLLTGKRLRHLQRNSVWKTEESLWRDVMIQSPENGRGLMNYGNTLMAQGDFEGALDYFHRAQSFNAAVFLSIDQSCHSGRRDETERAAEQHFKEALKLAPASPDSYIYYARWLLSHSRIPEAQRAPAHARWS